MTSALNDALVSTWVTGWARCRDYEVLHDGRIHAARRNGDDPAGGDWEYVLLDPEPQELAAVAQQVEKNPRRLLTVVGTPHGQAQMSTLQPLSSGEKLMVVNMSVQDVEAPIVPEEFEAVVDRHDGDWCLLTIQTSDEHEHGAGHAAARGRVTEVDGYAVFDRIWTSPDFRRKGLGSLVMRYLASLVLEHDVEEGLLVASADGQALYGHLGWTELADVTVLGVPEEHTADNPSHSDDR